MLAHSDSEYKKNSPYHELEKGQSLVELAVSLLFLLLILSGVFDLGMMLYSYLTLRDVAQEGATYGLYNPTDSSGILTRIQDSTDWPLDASQLTNVHIFCCDKSTPGDCTSGSCLVTLNPGPPPVYVPAVTSCQGQKITVKVEYNYELMMPVIGIFTGWNDIPLDASVTDTILESSEAISYLKSQGLSCP
jgi:Flp pilus assembly protein TadG